MFLGVRSSSDYEGAAAMDIIKTDESSLPFTPGGSNPWDTIPVQSQPDQDAIDDGDTDPFDWMDLRRMPDEYDALIGADETVLSANSAKLILVYPLDTAAVRDLTSTDGKGFTRGALMKAIDETYREIYTREAASQSAPTPAVEDRGTVQNRPASDGDFGVWGHDLNDLGISAIEVHKIGDDIWLDPVMES
jgi:hypothetical protein